MTNLEETSFLQHLTDIDSVAHIVKEGFDPELLPTPEVRPVYEYALRYYFDSGQTRAVTPQALGTYEISVGNTLLDVLDSLEIDVSEDPELSIVDAMEKLAGRYIVSQAQKFTAKFVTDMGAAPTPERLQVATDAANELMTLITRVTPRRTQIDAGQGVKERIEAYNNGPKDAVGLGLGIKELDSHTLYVHPGEVMIFGAFAKVGKSMWSLISALHEWRKGRDVALFTLENPMDTTLDRLCCAAVCVDSETWQKRQCNESDIKRVEEFRDQLLSSKNKIHVLHPDKGQRSVEFMMRKAQVLNADSLIIDQISHIEHPNPGRKPRWEQVRDIMQDLHLAASTANPPMPVLAFHQISRDGKKAADKRGEHVMEDFAESSEVERSADFAVMLFQSTEQKTCNQALLQLVAARRSSVRKWLIDWHPGTAFARVRGQVG